MTLRQQIKTIMTELSESHPDLADRIRCIRVEVSNRMTSSAGRAIHRGQIMRLSGVFFGDSANVQSDLRKTITHEVAHLLVGPRMGHGGIWQAMDRKLGGTGERCHTMESRAPSRMVETKCGGCGDVVPVGPIVYRRLVGGRPYIHRKCGGRLS